MQTLRARWVLAAAIASMIALAGCGMSSDLAGPSVPATPYVLFTPIQSNATYLMDLQGQLVHRWVSASTAACSVYLLENGQILRPRSLGPGSFAGGGCNGGRVEILDWDSRVVWSYEYSGPTFEQHHDVKRMPNGHVLLVAWEIKTAAKALAAGRNADTIPSNRVIWVDHVIEVDPQTNRIVWEWHAWDHLLAPGEDPSEHPERIDPNARTTAASDWTHVNAVDYNPSLDQVMVSSRNFSEIWIVDHGTTTDEAAGHAGGRRGRGGDLLFRWGSPGNYGRAPATLRTAQRALGRGQSVGRGTDPHLQQRRPELPALFQRRPDRADARGRRRVCGAGAVRSTAGTSAAGSSC